MNWDEIINRALKSMNGETEQFHLTDTGNAEHFATLYGANVRFDHTRKRWLVWNQHRWVPDADGEIYRLAVQSARKRHIDAVSIDNTDEKKRVARWAISSESRVRLDATLGVARNLSPLADKGDEWDQLPMLLACPNGVIDLTTGELRDGKPEDRISMSATTEYQPSAECPRWTRFLDEVFEGNDGVIYFVHKALGYSLTGDMREQCVFMAYGSGSNGKSVLFGTLRHILGDYAFDVPFSTFLRTSGESSNDLANLERKRFVVSSEVLAGRKIDESRLKNLTGGDVITARYLYEQYFTFTPQCKVWIFANHKPVVGDDSFGFWRRVRLIPFNKTFTLDEQDQTLPATLKAEAPGILRWLVEGCLMWQREGLSPIPGAVSSATEEYREESDPLSSFIDEMCEIGAECSIHAGEIWKKYQSWADTQSLGPRDRLGSKTFYIKMGEHFTKTATKTGKIYVGIGLKTDEKMPSGDGSVTVPSLKVTVQESFRETPYAHTHVETLGKQAFKASPVTHSNREKYQASQQSEAVNLGDVEVDI